MLCHTKHDSADLEPAEVDVGTTVQSLEDLVGVLLHAVLDVHLAPGLVTLLSGDRQVVPAPMPDTMHQGLSAQGRHLGGRTKEASIGT